MFSMVFTILGLAGSDATSIIHMRLDAASRPDVSPVVGEAHVVGLVPFRAEVQPVYDRSVFRRRYVHVYDGEKSLSFPSASSAMT